MTESVEQDDEVLRTTETGYLRTVTIRRPDGRTVLRREPGRLRTPGPGLVPAMSRVAEVTRPGVDWALPRAHGSALYFDVPGQASWATLLLAGMPTAALARMVSPLGPALAGVHDLGAAAGREPTGLRRLTSWLLEGTGPGAAARLHAQLLDEPELRELLLDGARRLRSAPATLVLGAPGGNALYPAPSGESTTVLVTDELADAPPEWDLGWLLGESLELANTPFAASEPQSLDGHPVAETVLAGYDGPIDRSLLARAAVLRWAIHLHDYAAYVDWPDNAAMRFERLAALARDPGLVLTGA
ncbi:hypothetical protein SAMN04487905_10891 [Actinopolyspora xinjiangensis]|uniref:Phosphotransferase enzyme family protein n=1 Tax=Actinopolyspora xinjiangensis TaxID=405564 RepID=A0A1H0V8H6_9ACTN|nr:hypothetical protein [Actinopolyspora xinjiangensis]SDP74859.1 hypothetical protein SAMN04487905_10891 [Actinopolyspora xinjiangensis]